MKLILVPEMLRNPVGNPPFSLGMVHPGGGQWLNLSGVSCPAAYPSIGEEVITVMEEVFERVIKGGFTPEDIFHVRLMIVGKSSAALVQEINGAYRRAFSQVGVAATKGSVLPGRETFFVYDLIGGAMVEATVKAWSSGDD